MRRVLAQILSTLAAFLGLTATAQISVAGTNTIGIDYLADANELVYGGARFFFPGGEVEDIDTRTVYGQQLEGGQRVSIYSGEGVVQDIQASPRGELIGVLELFGVGNGVHYYGDSILRILNLEGEVLDSISQVRLYAWSPSGSHIAYVTGDYYEGGVGFSTTGTWIYDLSSRQSKRVHSGGIDVQWAQEDGAAYIYDPWFEESNATVVLRFDPETDQLAATARKGIYFSRDGRYYYSPGLEGLPLRVFLAETDAEIPIDIEFRQGRRTAAATYARGWLDERTLVVPSVIPEPGDRREFTFNVETGEMRRAPGRIMPVDLPDGRVLVVVETSVSVMDIDDFSLVE